jgi:WD40 repeat protein
MILKAIIRPLTLLLLAALPRPGELSVRSSSDASPPGKITRLLEGIVAPNHQGQMALSPDGKYLALPEWKRGIDLWDLTAGKSTLLPNGLGEELAGGYVVYSKDGRSMATSSGRGISIWSVPDGKTPKRISRERSVVKLVFTDADRKLLGEHLPSDKIGPQDHRSVIIRWDVSSGERLSAVEFGVGQYLKTISPDGRYGVVDDFQAESMGVYDLTTRAKIFGLPKYGDFIFSDDGSTIVRFETNQLSITDIPSGKQVKRFDVPPPAWQGSTVVLAVSSKAKLLAVGRYPDNHFASLIRLDTGKVAGTVECGPRLTICEHVRLSADGRTLVTGTCAVNSKDKPVLPWLKIWRLPENW